MALIVPKQLKTSQGGVETSPRQENKFQALRWTAIGSSNSHTTSPVTVVDGPADLAVQSHVENTARAKQDLGGIMSPKPIGIITFEDILDAILQKTSRDERDFFGRGNIQPPTKAKKPADCMEFTCNYSQKDQGVSISPHKVVSYKPSVPGTVRRRNISTRMLLTSKECAMDGVDERSIDDTIFQCTKLCKVRNKHEESCHSQNRRSSFHGGNTPTQKEALARSSSQSKAESLPSRRAIAAVLPDGSTPFWRHVSAAPRLPQLQRVTPFSRQHYSSYERAAEDDIQNDDIVCSVTPASSKSSLSSRPDAPLNITGPGVDLGIEIKCPRVPENTTEGTHYDVPETISVISWCPRGFADVDEWNTQLSDLPALEAGPREGPQSFGTSSDAAREEATTKPQPYRGFPPELLDPSNMRKEDHLPNQPANTLPRISGPFTVLSGKHGDMPQPREESFHDNRALLPSQRRSINNSANMTVSGTRSSSFWF
jgi:metal transporter CNNM